MKEYFYFSIIAILISFIFFKKKDKKNFKLKKHPSGDYVLKIIVNDKFKKDCKLVLNILKKSVFEIVPILFEDKILYNKWRSCGEGKVVLVANEEDLGKINITAEENNIPSYKYDDVMVVLGPGLKSELNGFTGHLKLF